MKEKILIACNDGKIYEIKVPDAKKCDNTQTYLKEFECSSYLLRMMEDQKPKTEEMDLKFLLKSKNEEKK